MTTRKALSVALASALLAAGVAHAESNVNLYGVLDVGVTVSKARGGDTLVQESAGNYAGNRWGLKGVEDLGGGNAVFFQLEQGFSLNSGTIGQNKGAFSRQANLGVRGSWGEVSAGRFGALTSDVGSYSILPASAVGTSYSYTGNLQGVISATDRLNNALVYVSPEFAGLTFTAMYSNGVETDDQKWNQNDHYYGFGATYTHGKLTAGLIWELYDNRLGDNNEKGRDSNLITAGASYDFGVVTLYGVYQYALHAQVLPGGVDLTSKEAKVTNLGNEGKNGITQHAFSLSLSTQVGAGTASLQGNYAHGKVNDRTAGDKNYDVLGVGAAYLYPISKRTSWYSFAGYSTAKKALKHTEGISGWAFTSGLNHTF